MAPSNDIDILESSLRKRGKLLDILLQDKTTGKNIIWVTDSYKNHDAAFNPEMPIKPDLVTGENGKLIQPRAAKSREEQQRRTKVKGEVFTPFETIAAMNGAVYKSIKPSIDDKNDWKRYIKEPILEITCGEAPFIVTRYNPAVHTNKIKDVNIRVGFLDKKLQVVSGHCTSKTEGYARRRRG